MSFMDEMLPETAEAFVQLRKAIFKDSFLDVKTKELIAISCSVIMRCQHCVDTHAQRAVAVGATKEEIAEAISVAMFIAGGTQIGWTNVYTENVYDKIFNKNDEKKAAKDAAKDEICGCDCGCRD